jgi:hypothetical protein
MKEAYRLIRKDGVSGIDGATADDYGANLEANLSDLLDRIKSGRHQIDDVVQRRQRHSSFRSCQFSYPLSSGL